MHVCRFLPVQRDLCTYGRVCKCMRGCLKLTCIYACMHACIHIGLQVCRSSVRVGALYVIICVYAYVCMHLPVDGEIMCDIYTCTIILIYIYIDTYKNVVVTNYAGSCI